MDYERTMHLTPSADGILWTVPSNAKWDDADLHEVSLHGSHETVAVEGVEGEYHAVTLYGCQWVYRKKD